MHSIGVDIGGMTIKAGLVSEDGSIIKKLTAPTPLGSAEQLADSIALLIKSLADQSREACSHIGVTVPGTFNEKGVVTRLCNIGLENIRLVRMLFERLGMRVELYNDADAAALAELKTGSLRGVTTGVLLTIGTGVGGGLILNGSLFRGGLGRGTEPGHMILARGGPICSCGNKGCAETICSATYLAARAYRACKERRGMIYSLHKEGRPIDAKLLIDCAAAGDEYAADEFGVFIDALSDYVASIVNLLDPQVIAIGGGVSGAGELLLAPLKRAVAQKSFFGSSGSIVSATAGNDAGIIGAAFPV